MKKIIVLFLVFSFLIINAFQTMKNPQSEISSNLITAKLLLPDNQKGYYMGTRFDWSGVISDLSYNGHTFFGKWFDKYSPTLHDAIMGPVEEFAPLGYKEAGTSGYFAMIGIGVLKKPDNKDHDRFGYYEIVNPGQWKVKESPDRIEFNHKLNSDEYSYDYTKTVSLIKDRPVLELSHVLKNTGQKTIVTNVYNHNFFVIDNQPVGPGFVVTFPFNPKGEGQGFGTIAELKDNRIIFNRNLNKGETVFCGSLTVFRNDPKDLDIRVENKTTGAGVRITSDRPLSKLIFWACPTTLCPETYVDIKIEPGQEFTWKFCYEFYTDKK
jgi:hypothetical protein